MANRQNLYYVFIGTYTGGQSEGIYVTRFDAETGLLEPARLAGACENPTWLVLGPTGDRLYTGSSLVEDATVSAWALDRGTGELSLLNSRSAHGQKPCHLSLTADGRHLLTANFGDGTGAMYPIEADGTLGEASDTYSHTGSSVHPDRQGGPHCHSITVHPDGRFAVVADLGADKVVSYRIDQDASKLEPISETSVQAGQGPRHLAFSRDGKFAWLLTEMGSELVSFSVDAETGRLEVIDHISALPEDFAGSSAGADVQLHPLMPCLYASNRGHDSIATFRIDEKSGRAELIGNTPTAGPNPRGFRIDPTGRWLLSASQNESLIGVSEISLDSGAPQAVGRTIQAPSPVCIRLLAI
jgi:6-phosphogluconolactonase